MFLNKTKQDNEEEFENDDEYYDNSGCDFENNDDDLENDGDEFQNSDDELANDKGKFQNEGDEYEDEDGDLDKTHDDFEDIQHNHENDEDELANRENLLQDADNMNIKGSTNVDQVSHSSLFNVFNKHKFTNSNKYLYFMLE